MNDLGKGIGTAGIWIGVGIAVMSGHSDPTIAGAAMFATAAVWLFGYLDNKK